MIPSMPPREGQLGFLYLPPFRIQGISVAGEQTVIQVPELDLCFDMGQCTRASLSAPTIALSHCHMDHLGGLPYWFSQRQFQKIGTGRCVCHPRAAEPLRAMMRAWIDLELQRTPHEIIALEPDSDFELKNNLFLRAIETSHTAPSLGFVVIERRSKLKDEFHDLPQDRLRDLKQQGVEITRTIEIPLVAYTGDTEPGPFLFRDEFANAKVIISECTFFESEHRSRAKIGKHLHVNDLSSLLQVWKAEYVVLTHISRRTAIPFARECVTTMDGGAHAHRVHLLMDFRTNKQRYERQVAEAEDRAELPQKSVVERDVEIHETNG
ncbi:MAG: MBL fold metallo-hydrolase [Phycisphaerae bacterium]|nr:MBL fold metallo-hydrolase [Phycisphaerae bacterium]